MKKIRPFIDKYAAAIYFILTFIITWGSIFLVVGSIGFPISKAKIETAGPMVYVGMLLGPSIAGILMIEALGFAEQGKGIDLVKAGDVAIDGRIPVNTGGGLIAFGHPVGATGVKQAFEIYRHMKGECGDYQVSPPPEHGISANMGGDDRTSVVTIYRK